MAQVNHFIIIKLHPTTQEIAKELGKNRLECLDFYIENS